MPVCFPSPSPRNEIRILDGIRVASPARAICELAATARRNELEHAVQEAVARRIVDDRALLAAIDTSARRPGIALVRAILAAEAGIGYTRSYAERMLASIVVRSGLPKPEKNVVVCGERVDALWREARVIVEVDGRTTHDTGIAFERDRRRDQVLTAAGFSVIRLTFRQLIDEPLRVAAVLARMLAH